MTKPGSKSSFFSLSWKVIPLIGIVLLLALPTYSQTQKGDKPVRNNSKLRDSRFKSRSKQGDRPVTKDPAGRRVRTKNQSSAQRAVIPYQQPKAAKARYKKRNEGDRAGKPIGGTFSSQPRDNQRAYTGPGGRVKARSATGRVSNVFKQFGRNSQRAKPRDTQHPVSNRSQLARLKKMQRNPADAGGRGTKVQVRSASKAYISRKSINPMARFSRGRKKQGDQPTTKDLAGRPLLKKNYETPRPGVIVQGDPYHGRKRVGDKPYRATSRTPQSATRAGRAWKGDIAGRKVRGRNYRTKFDTGGSRYSRSGNAPRPRFGDGQLHRGRKISGGRSATQPGEKRTGTAPVPVRSPGIGARGIGNYRGNTRLFESKPGMGKQGADYTGSMKARRPQKGGGSVSGKHWNNKQTPVVVRPPSSDTQRAGRFQGNVKSRRAEKGGGSVSARLWTNWNNKQTPVAVRPPSGDTQRAGRFQGNVKSRRAEKGGGSVSAKLWTNWNNKQTPVAVRPPSSDTQRAGRFQGNLKSRRPEKGGGSVSGKLWNNKETPIPVRPPSNETQRAGSYQGNLKAHRPEKGGGSVSGKLWNNKETPIPVKPPSNETRRASSYPGGEMLFEARPSMVDQGEEFTGTIRLKRFQKNYVKSPNQVDEAILKARPHKSTFRVDDLQVKVKQYNYIRNPSSAEDALKVREPGKAFGKSTDYQGNIKMRKFELFEKHNRELHPDSKFVKLNKNNVDEERGFVTNVKLWWAKHFRKNENLPSNVKEKEHKPRYDKNEQGLWYD